MYYQNSTITYVRSNFQIGYDGAVIANLHALVVHAEHREQRHLAAAVDKYVVYQYLLRGARRTEVAECGAPLNVAPSGELTGGSE